MPPALNLDDMDSLDGGQTVTMTQAVTLTEQTVEHALKRPLSLREIELFTGVLTYGDMKFNLPAADLDFAPDIDDVITELGGQTWDIKAVDLLALGTRYRCWCQKGPTV
jgi:hypothetical protein